MINIVKSVLRFLKKNLVLIVVIVIFAAGGLIAWNIKKEQDVGWVMYDEFKIEETASGKVISHKHTKFEITIPQDWQTTNEIADFGIVCFSTDLELNRLPGPYGPPIPEKGCTISVRIKKEIEDSDSDILYSYTKNLIDLCSEGWEYCDYELIKISDKTGLKNIHHIEKEGLVGDDVSIEIPRKEKVYTIEAYLFGQDKERCGQEFDNILQTVKIK